MAHAGRWQRYVDAAVSQPRTSPAEVSGPGTGAPRGHQQGPEIPSAGSPGYLRLILEQLRSRVIADQAARDRSGDVRRRTDLRLVPPALLVWATAVAASWLAPVPLAALCAVLMVSGVLLLLRTGARRRARDGVGRRARAAPRSLLATLAVAALLSAAAGAHSAIAVNQRHDGAIAEAVAAHAAVVAELEIAGAPRQLKVPGRSGLGDRWAVPATLLVLISEGRRIETEAGLLVMGGSAWEHFIPGQRLRATGKLKPPEPGQTEAGILSASSTPVTLRVPDAWQQGPGMLRDGFTAASARLGGDARGLLPGMVTGDTSRLDAGLDGAMKTVGMTHLTAVSGANCSLILGTLLLAARSLRLPRLAAAAVSLAGLGMFVLMVGPDASVLRAALMGAIGLGSLAFGRTGRGLSFLCLAVIGLLLMDPALSTRFGFLLSVLATLGIVVAGRRIMDWLPPAVPRWVAAGLAVPLSAQIFCGPVIVMLQPQFTTFALPANVVAAALVPPVTLLGTAAVPLLPLFPAPAAALMAAAGAFAGGVAGVARFFASLPGAAPPWPEGVFGLCTMALFSTVALAVLWLVLHPLAALRLTLAAHARTAALLDRMPGRLRSMRPRGSAVPGHRRRGLVDRSRHGTLRVNEPISGRNQEWLLPRPNAPGLRRRTPPPGGTWPRPP